jgi:hypothetical protein
MCLCFTASKRFFAMLRPSPLPSQRLVCPPESIPARFSMNLRWKRDTRTCILCFAMSQ